MDYVLWLVVATGVARLPVAPPLPADSQSASTTEATRARADLGLAWPSDLRPFRPTLFAEGAPAQRPRAVDYGDFYYTRLAIHKIASYATAPLFVAEYVLGQKLYSNPPGSSSTRNAHQLVADGVAGLFVVNTVTGVWNLWDSRRDPAGRVRRYLHAALMLAADAGFVATGATAPSPRRIRLGEPTNIAAHRTIAIASMGTALASYLMMLVWKS